MEREEKWRKWRERRSGGNGESGERIGEAVKDAGRMKRGR
jgi:hypothetical protein